MLPAVSPACLKRACRLRARRSILLGGSSSSLDYRRRPVPHLPKRLRRCERSSDGEAAPLRPALAAVRRAKADRCRLGVLLARANMGERRPVVRSATSPRPRLRRGGQAGRRNLVAGVRCVANRRRKTATPPAVAESARLDWLFAEYRADRRYTKLDPKIEAQPRGRLQAGRRLCPEGWQASRRRSASVLSTPALTDDLYEKLLFLKRPTPMAMWSSASGAPPSTTR